MSGKALLSNVDVIIIVVVVFGLTLCLKALKFRYQDGIFYPLFHELTGNPRDNKIARPV